MYGIVYDMFARALVVHLASGIQPPLYSLPSRPLTFGASSVAKQVSRTPRPVLVPPEIRKPPRPRSEKLVSTPCQPYDSSGAKVTTVPLFGCAPRVASSKSPR